NLTDLGRDKTPDPSSRIANQRQVRGLTRGGYRLHAATGSESRRGLEWSVECPSGTDGGQNAHTCAGTGIHRIGHSRAGHFADEGETKYRDQSKDDASEKNGAKGHQRTR